MVEHPEEQAGTRGGALIEEDEDTMDMAALLAQEEQSQIHSLRRGEVVEGTIISISRDGVIVDIGAKSEGLIPVNEMHSLGADPLSKVETGDKLVAYVMQPETSEGEVLLSIDRARGERGWRTLQTLFESGESFEGEVTGFNKGGLLVNVEGVAAFVPLSQLVGLRPERSETGAGLQTAVGRTLRLKVIELNRRRNRVILSERGALQEWRSQQKERLLEELEEGEIRKGRISSIRNFGVFVDLGGADGLVHLSEISWDRTKTPEELFDAGRRSRRLRHEGGQRAQEDRAQHPPRAAGPLGRHRRQVRGRRSRARNRHEARDVRRFRAHRGACRGPDSRLRAG